MGLSQEHIWPIVEKYNPHQIVLLSSRELKEDMEKLAERLRQHHHMTTEILYLDPFREDSLHSMAQQINKKYREISQLYQNEQPVFYMGITGGTNLMVLAAGLVASVQKIPMHYVLNPQHQHEDDSPSNKIFEIAPYQLSSIEK